MSEWPTNRTEQATHRAVGNTPLISPPAKAGSPSAEPSLQGSQSRPALSCTKQAAWLLTHSWCGSPDRPRGQEVSVPRRRNVSETARCKGVVPSLFFALGSAPAPMRQAMVADWAEGFHLGEFGPPTAARCNGSVPRRFLARTCAPALMSSAAISGRYEAAAKCKAVSPELM
jgi:hypothetical protein